jgi:NAD+ synthase (glutamine-hydrolysing)
VKNIVIGQINPWIGDISGNVERIERVLHEARKSGAHVVVFPQFSLCGVPVHDLVFHKDFIDDIESAISELALKTAGLTVVVGTILRNSSSVHDGAVILHDGREIGRQHVMAQVWTLDEFSFGLLIGESFAQAFSSTPDIVFHLVASAWNSGVVSERTKLAQNIVSHAGSPYLCVNLVGGNDAWIFDGRSFLLDEEGKLSFQSEVFVEGAFLVQQGNVAGELSEIENVYRALRLGIRDFFKKSQKKEAIVPLSGGIDSAVVAKLAVDSLGAEHVHALLLPSHVTPGKSYEDAVALAHQLGMVIHILPIDSVVTAAKEALKSLDCVLSEVAEDNLQARVRSLFTMALANVSDALWLATGNKSELMVGYSTLYGDLGGALAPIGDLFKTQVYSLASCINAKEESIPRSIMDRAPSAELHEGQLDSDVLPPYPVLDAILQHMFVEGDSFEETAHKVQVPVETVLQMANRVLQYEYKRRQAPCALKVFTQIEAKYPIENSYRFSKGKQF